MWKNFFADPKVWIPLLAIVISIVNFVGLCWFRWNQNQKWTNLNRAVIDIKEVYFIGWEEIEREKAKQREWGYRPVLHSVVKDHVHTNKVRLYEQLLLWDNEKNEKIRRSNSVQTMKGVMEEAKRLGLEMKNIGIRKQRQMQINLENIGKTKAKNVTCTLKVEGENNTRKVIFKSNVENGIEGGKIVNINRDFYFPLDVQVPEVMNFVLGITYMTVENEKIEEQKFIRCETSRNRWTWGNEQKT